MQTPQQQRGRAHVCSRTAPGLHTRVHAQAGRSWGRLLRETGCEWHFNALRAGTMRCVFKGLLKGGFLLKA